MVGIYAKSLDRKRHTIQALAKLAMQIREGGSEKGMFDSKEDLRQTRHPCMPSHLTIIASHNTENALDSLQKTYGVNTLFFSGDVMGIGYASIVQHT